MHTASLIHNAIFLKLSNAPRRGCAKQCFETTVWQRIKGLPPQFHATYIINSTARAWPTSSGRLIAVVTQRLLLRVIILKFSILAS